MVLVTFTGLALWGTYRLQRRIDIIEDRLYYSFTFDAVEAVVLDNKTDSTFSCQLGVRMMNHADIPIRFQVKEMGVVFGEKTLSDPVYDTSPLVVSPKRLVTYNWDTIRGFSQQGYPFEGVMEYTMHYGTIEHFTHGLSEKLAVTIRKGAGARYRVISSRHWRLN